MRYQMHESSIVDEGAEIGDGTRIWHFVHVCGKAKIGRNCSLGQNVYVANDVTIGSNVKVQNNVSIYDGLTIGNDVFVGPSVVFTNVYNPRSAISRVSEYKQTRVADGATLGANSTIVCGVDIGQHAFIAAGAVVRDCVKPFALMAGVPAKQIGWMSQYGERLDLPLSGHGEAACPGTGQVYVLSGTSLNLAVADT